MAGDPEPARAAALSVEGTLRRADLVALGQVRLVKPGIGGAQAIARFEVERTLLAKPGAAAEGLITVFVGGPQDTGDPHGPSTPFLAPGAEGRYVLFLVRTRAGSGWSLDTLFGVVGDEGNEKVEALVQDIALAAIADPAERRRKALAHFLELAGAERPWTRVHGARELYGLSASAPDLFTADVLRELEALRAKAFDPAAQALLDATRARFGGPAPGPAGPLSAAPARERAPPPPEFFAIRRRLADAKDAPARIELLTELSKAGNAESAPDLLAAMDASDACVRECVGRLGRILLPIGHQEAIDRGRETGVGCSAERATGGASADDRVAVAPAHPVAHDHRAGFDVAR